jgi:hypothetical protein
VAKLDEQITLLQQRLAQMKVRQQRIDARRRAIEADRERKADLRRRILVGTLVMAKVRDGGFDPDLLRAWLDSNLTRASDRALFDLPPVEGAAASDGR